MTYSERGGLRYGTTYWKNRVNATWPFAVLSFTAETLEVQVSLGSLFKRKFVFDRSEITVLRRRDGLISRGVQIEHTKPEWPKVIVFWSFHPHRLLEVAATMGYPIKEN
jgi:hypothetical protein